MLNKIISGLFTLFLFLFIGNAINHYFIHMVPGSIIGMILLFIALQAKIVKEEAVETVASYLIYTMPIFFLPPSVGLMNIMPVIGDDILAIFVTVIVSTIAVFFCVGWCQQLLNRKGGKSE